MDCDVKGFEAVILGTGAHFRPPVLKFDTYFSNFVKNTRIHTNDV